MSLYKRRPLTNLFTGFNFFREIVRTRHSEGNTYFFLVKEYLFLPGKTAYNNLTKKLNIDLKLRTKKTRENKLCT